MYTKYIEAFCVHIIYMLLNYFFQIYASTFFYRFPCQDSQITFFHHRFFFLLAKITLKLAVIKTLCLNLKLKQNCNEPKVA